nr:hypothetical protein [Citrobacter freundii]
MNITLTIFLCMATFLLNGCVHSPIDAKKTSVPRTEDSISKDATTKLTDKDIFGNETTLAVSEEDIQAALDGGKFSVPLNSAVILVQSGSRAPEMTMQQEMGKYYQVSTYSGIPDRQKPLSCNKVKMEEGNAVASENMNYMQALRYIAAKGQQKAVIVYWDTLQTGRNDAATKATIWSDSTANCAPSPFCWLKKMSRIFCAVSNCLRISSRITTLLPSISADIQGKGYVTKRTAFYIKYRRSGIDSAGRGGFHPLPAILLSVCDGRECDQHPLQTDCS